MRLWLAFAQLSSLVFAATFACKSERSLPLQPPASVAPPASAPALPETEPWRPHPTASAVAELEKKIQAQKLRPPARRGHEPRLAFGKGVFGQLTADALCVFDTEDFRLLGSEPLEGPRAVVSLADGSLLAFGAKTALHWRLEKRRARPVPRPTLLPGVELYADAQAADVFWIFNGGSGGLPATLSSFRLEATETAVPLPEQTITLESPPAGVLGVTREAVWVYLTPGHAERFGPGGARLPGFPLPEAPLPTWLLPSRRLDQGLWLDETGQATRVLLSPSFKRLSDAATLGPVVSADVGEEGQLTALVEVTGPGPRFELELLNAELYRLGRAVLPSEPPTGSDDWVQVVTANQSVVVAPREPRVAVGGPDRVTIFDAGAKKLFSIPSH
jgi:hypothetical protein